MRFSVSRLLRMIPTTRHNGMQTPTQPRNNALTYIPTAAVAAPIAVPVPLPSSVSASVSAAAAAISISFPLAISTFFSDRPSMQRISQSDANHQAQTHHANPTQKPAASSSHSPSLRYPVVLVHGLLGFDSLFSFDYFVGLREFFSIRGIRIFTPALPPAAPIAVRALALQAAIEKEFGVSSSSFPPRFHLIGHSMGGLDSRYLISQLQPESENRVASLVTLVTPHHGTKAADFVLAEATKEQVEETTKTATAAEEYSSSLSSSSAPFLRFRGFRFSSILSRLHSFSGIDLTGLANLTTKFMEKFNEEIPMRAGTRYFSFGGECDYKSIHYGIQGKFLKKFEGPNDGIVSVESSKYGEYIRTVPFDHTQFIGLFAGDRHLKLFEEIILLLVKVEFEDSRNRQKFDRLEIHKQSNTV